jgi:UDP-N-acetylbacillosamine N-acetyltransferase
MKQGLVMWGESGHALVAADISRLVKAYQIISMIDDINSGRAQAWNSPDTRCRGGERFDGLCQREVRTTVVGFGNCRGRLQVAMSFASGFIVKAAS